MKKLILLFFLILLPLNVNAKEDLDIICDKYTFKEFEEFTCRTSINTSFEFNKITFDVNLDKGLSVDDVRTNYTNLWKVTLNKNTVTAEIIHGEPVSGLQEFGILLFSTLDFGNQNISLKNIKLVNTEENKTLEIEDSNKEIKVLSSENKLKSISIDDKKIERFSSSIYNYTINVNKSTTKINLSADLIDKNAEINGIGEIELESHTTVVPIIIKSEAGLNKIYYINIIKEDLLSPDIKASLIELKDNKNNIINFNFNPEVYEYNIEVDPKLTSLSLNIKLEDSDLSLVKEYGNRTITIEDGDNVILIKIKNSKNEIKTYVLNVTKLLSNKSSNCYLKSLVIDNYDLRFNKKVKTYKLSIKKYIKKLNISAIAEDNKSIVNIIGNEDLKTGSIIKVIVKAENESRFTYQIQITQQKTNILVHILCTGLIAITILIINSLFKKHKKKSIKKKEIIKVPTKEEKVSKEETVKSKEKKDSKKPDKKTSKKVGDQKLKSSKENSKSVKKKDSTKSDHKTRKKTKEQKLSEKPKVAKKAVKNKQKKRTQKKQWKKKKKNRNKRKSNKK